MAFKIEANTLHISNIFIDYYMTKAQPAYVLAYLYAYRHTVDGNTSLCNEDIAKALNMLEGDVAKAWEYWEKQGLIRKSDDDTIEFLTVAMPKPEKTEKLEKPEKIFTKQDRVILERQPEYSPMELARYLESSETVKELFVMGQTLLGKLLSQNDMSILFGFYDWLRLPLEVIEMLLVYSIKNNHRSLHYIEKVALTWAEEGIDDPQKAMEYINRRTGGYKEIMKAFGISGRGLLPAEEAYVKTWLTEYQMPLEVAAIACEKTVIQTGKVSFPYAETILSKWNEVGIRTIEAVEQQEKQFQEAGKAKKAQKEAAAQQRNVISKPSPVKQSRFVNFEQREWDFDELERLESEKRKKKYQKPADEK